ncbi:hypothetical protein B0H10DRAFT_2234057 [Mycena sp. CBHHK59/15]|nr:hypothetical protein B0H10DRAFT_2234057 [Mycena sp. CBHHK59/15]
MEPMAIYLEVNLLMDGLFSDVATPSESFDVLKTWPQVLFALRRDPPCLLWGSMRASSRKLNYLYNSDSISRIIARQDQDALVQTTRRTNKFIANYRYSVRCRARASRPQAYSRVRLTLHRRAPRMPSTALPRTTPSRAQMDGAPPRVQSALPRSASTRRVLPAGTPASSSSPRAMPAYRRLGFSRAVVPRGLGRPAPSPSRMSAVDVRSSATPTTVAHTRAGAHAISPRAALPDWMPDAHAPSAAHSRRALVRLASARSGHVWRSAAFVLEGQRGGDSPRLVPYPALPLLSSARPARAP